MGIAENMQHLERCEAVSRGKVEGQASKNGECSITGRPKWKRRKVSAVRDFPVGCGWNAPPPHPRPTELVVSDGSTCEQIVGTGNIEALLDSDYIQESKTDAKFPPPHPRPTEPVVSDGSACEQIVGSGKSEAPLDSDYIQESKTDAKSSPPHPRPTEPVVSDGSACEQIVGSGKSEAPLDSDYIQESKTDAKSPSPQPLEDSVQIEVPKNSTNLDVNFEKPRILSNMADESHLKNGEPSFNVSTTALENADLVSLLNPLNNEVSELSKNSPKAETTAPVEDTILSTRQFDFLKQPRSWNYPPRRKISAVRDFPPNCGPNAPPSKGDCTKVVASSKSISLGGGSCSPEVMLTNGTLSDDFKEIGFGAENGDNLNRKLNTLIENIVSNTFGEKGEVEPRDVSNKAIGNKLESGMSSELRMEMKDKREETIIVTCQNDVNQQPKLKSHKYIKKSGVEVNVVAGKVENEIVVYAGEVGGVDAQNNKEIVVDDTEEKGEVGTMILHHYTSKSLQKYCSGISGSKTQILTGNVGLDLKMNRVVVQGLFAASNCPWEQQNRTIKPDRAVKKECSKSEQGKSKTKKARKEKLGSQSFKRRSSPNTEVANEDMGALVVYDHHNDGDSSEDEQQDDFHVAYRSQSQPPEYDVTLLPLGPSSSSGRDDNHENIVTRNKVRETLRIFQVVCRKLLQEEEANLKLGGIGLKRVDLPAAKIVKDRGKYVNTGKSIVGPVPGVEVGDEFHYRVELAIIGLHRPFQAGIDYVKQGGKIVASSVVASGGYADVLDNSDELTYTGSGGKDSDKQPEDQKLERGNLALKNSADEKTPVRVIRGFKETKASDSSETKGKVVSTFTYDGLYRVEKYWQEPGPHEKLIFQFQLVRIPGQPALAWNEVKKTKKLKIREGVCVLDISQGKEKTPICAINTIDDETPPEFEYITEMIYPNWCNPIPPKGCGCAGRCSESERCSCAVKNGVEIPYNRNGAIVEAKPLVYECGPSCKCPRSCYNRVTQNGIKFQLEVFKTGSRGWGVRSLNSISSGSFICEYLGELLDDKEAEQRMGSDEYLFDIGHNFNDQTLCSEPSKLADSQLDNSETVEDGFTIDAAQYGNIGRFINHSCSPNLYAQNVLYDHEDRRMPHIMLFAAENIPPLQELTYHYNYTIDEVRDSHGNVKKKNCYCGSSECVGRMY